MKDVLKFSVPKTLPIMTGYLFLGASYGILARSNNIPSTIVILMSFFIYSGSMQFAAVNVLQAMFDPIGVFVLTLMVNARHIFYGITLLEKYKTLKKERFYTIFGLTDETFSLNVSLDIPKELDRGKVYFTITALNHFYWIVGTTLGVFLSKIISFDIQGIEFVLTALFVTIFVDQWLASENHESAIIGVFITIVSLIIFGSRHFLIPAMLIIIIFFLVKYKKEGVVDLNDYT